MGWMFGESLQGAQIKLRKNSTRQKSPITALRGGPAKTRVDPTRNAAFDKLLVSVCSLETHVIQATEKYCKPFRERSIHLRAARFAQPR